MFRDLHPNIRIRIYTSFFSRIIGSMVFPFMAIYFTKQMNATMAGIFLTFTVVVSFLASLYGGYLADTLGRKRMMVLGEWMKVFAFAGMLLANSPWITSAWATFVMLVILSISSGVVNPAAEAMLIDVSTKESRAFMYSVNYWAVNLSIMLGMIIGGWLFQTHFFELLIALVAISILTLWMTIALIQETYVPQAGKHSKKPSGIKPILQSYRSVITDSTFVWFTLGGIAILSIEFQRNNYISVRLAEDIIPQTLTYLGSFELMLDGVRLLSLLTVVNTIMIVLFTAVTAKWIRTKAEQPMMYTGFILFGLGYAFLAFSNHIPGLFIAVIVLSIGELLYVPTRQTILADIVDDSRRGAYMAFNGFVFQIGKVIGSVGIILGKSIGGMAMGGLYMVLVLLGILFSWQAIQKREARKLGVVSKNI